MQRRTTQLRNFVEGGIVVVHEDTNRCIHTKNSTRDPEDNGDYTVCGLWFQGKSKCKNTTACVFRLTTDYPIRGAVPRMTEICIHSKQKISSNILTSKRVERLIGKKKESKYNTSW